MKYYALYYKKEDYEIKIMLIKEGHKMFEAFDRVLKNRDDECICQYNSNYMTCKTRKPIKEMARILKNKWVNECKRNLEKYESIKI